MTQKALTTTAAQAKMNKMLISENRGIIFLLGKFIGFQLELGFGIGIGKLGMRDWGGLSGGGGVSGVSGIYKLTECPEFREFPVRSPLP